MRAIEDLIIKVRKTSSGYRSHASGEKIGRPNVHERHRCLK